ncbi:hypothetical protein PISMIDRAFT_682802 [Pisolithus microcarpus 441]|uniref:Uncharacterized protein n=1 Tax=Pisolithus microcarpus 441 TaxID=765257 RepID=A0A0C9ZIA7_9AGAM|nr:hypothetical protein BKA83DRAFT_682802 [Pisolithus microcarpus]KIK19733.1 hypothetical protein PISMIDRAFT_682802 [Pisolithus microcarpus 441]
MLEELRASKPVLCAPSLPLDVTLAPTHAGSGAGSLSAPLQDCFKPPPSHLLPSKSFELPSNHIPTQLSSLGM